MWWELLMVRWWLSLKLQPKLLLLSPPHLLRSASPDVITRTETTTLLSVITYHNVLVGKGTHSCCRSLWGGYGGSIWGETRCTVTFAAALWNLWKLKVTFPFYRGADGDGEQQHPSGDGNQVWPPCCSGWSWGNPWVEEAPLPESISFCSAASVLHLFVWPQPNRLPIFAVYQTLRVQNADFAVDDWPLYRPTFQRSFKNFCTWLSGARVTQGEADLPYLLQKSYMLEFRWIVEERPDATNVNNWHWTEKNADSWSKAKIKVKNIEVLSSVRWQRIMNSRNL